MNKYYYDFHIHSCLSPCGDDDSTPANIAGMATLNNLQVVALTDHNTCRNCPGFFQAAKRHGIIPIAGMELTTAEDIHIVFLFENLEDALEFDKEINSRRILFPNRVDIYGEQYVMDGEDNVLETEPNLLSNATTVTVEECPALAERFGGICYPAHVDRQANGIIATLGTFPDIKGFKCCEFHDADKVQEYLEQYPIGQRKIIISSDAHYLWDMREENDFFLIDDEPYSSDLVRRRIFEQLR
ncbi:MAG: PHP domain-containing protein [Ruminococcus sp.]|nr:PHP domain-containing protein [Ruminococcus sp.]